MELQIDTLKCTGCRACEFACGFHLDDDWNPTGASLMLHRNEKHNYYGMMLKREKDVYLARPEGPEILKPGQQADGAGASSKPILMRPPCDYCEDEDEPYCVTACPAGVFSMKE